MEIIRFIIFKKPDVDILYSTLPNLLKTKKVSALILSTNNYTERNSDGNKKMTFFIQANSIFNPFKQILHIHSYIYHMSYEENRNAGN